MGEIINLSRLGPIYQEARAHSGTIAFEVPFQGGQFVFMMFLELKEQKEKEQKNKRINSQDTLFLYLRRSRQLLEIKLYGSHKNGDFLVYLNYKLEQAVRKELGIQGNNGDPFNFAEFMKKLNIAIPDQITFDDFRRTLRENYTAVKDYVVVDEAEKVYLVGPRKLSPGKHPREATLRKLYLFTEADKITIQRLITILKSKNITLAWSSEQKSSVTIETLMRNI